jgi:ATP-dependent Clp protease ATP-binding subunit ClpB
MQRMVSNPMTRRARAVTAADVAWAVSARTGIPVGRLAANEREKLLNLDKVLLTHVMGQDEAVTSVAETIRRGLSGIRDENRPVACMMFAGPTGVGKTELCRGLAEELFGSRDAMIRLDMTEYMEKHSVARLIGAPPGYVGYEEGGKLTEAVRRRPYCLVLLDELEKAHPDVSGILLQIMEEGCLTDSSGRRVSFRNAIVVMTTNIGGEIRGDGLGFSPTGRTGETEKALTQAFTPEFLGRLDRTVCFKQLDDRSMESIARKYLLQLRSRAAENGVQLILPNELPAFLGGKSKRKGGARALRRLVQEQVEGPLAVFLLKSGKKPLKVKAKLENETLQFRT